MTKASTLPYKVKNIYPLVFSYLCRTSIVYYLEEFEEHVIQVRGDV